MTSLAVLTRDLRLSDNPVLDAAGPDGVPVFVADPAIEALHASPNRQAFLAESLSDLDARLRERGTSLVHRRGPWLDTVLGVADEAGADTIHIGRDVSGFARARVRQLRSAADIEVVEHGSITAIPPDELTPSSSSDFYQVFTPYYRKWVDVPRRALVEPPEAYDDHGVPSEPLPEPPTEGTSPDRLRGGEGEAADLLEAWLPRAADYRDTRNALDDDGTSRLSAALHFGTISPRVVEDATADAEAFVRQLAWRDFYHQVLFHRPDASWSDYRDVEPAWNDDPDGLDAWRRGETGYPVVDAGMRQLKQTGWMHNRARMITASFLTKDLMIDWRLGARWFLTWLTDGDIANNNMGWQWVAGTGTDTNPTRIFNPILQSERHDPAGEYIRRWVPELADVTDDEIHDPGPLTRSATGYPDPIVDHHEAIRAYKQARGYGGT